MSDVMTYKGYNARVQYDAGDEIFFGKIAGIADGIGFHADTVKDLKAAFMEAVDDYLETCQKIGKNPDRPYSGKVLLRLPPQLHARIALAAELAGKSINQLGEEILDKAVA